MPVCSFHKEWFFCNHRIIFLFQLFLGLALSLQAHAEAPLSFDECVKEAAQYNPNLKSSFYNLRSSEFQRRAAYGGYLPQISGDLSTTRGNSGGLSNGAAGMPEIAGGSSDKTRSTASIGVTQNLFSGFGTEGAVEQAKANKQVSASELDIVTAQVSADLRTAFAALEYSQDYLKLTREIIRRRVENYELVELRYQSGNENQGSYMRAHATLSEARFNELQAGNSIGVAKQALAKVLGRDQAGDLQIVGSVLLAEPQPAPDFENLMKATPEERQALARKLAADAALKLAKSKFYPSIDLSGQLARENISGGGAQNKERWQGGISLSLPFFTGGQNYYGAKSALENVLAAGADRESIDRALLVTLKQTHFAYVEALARVKVDREFVEAGVVRAEIARAKYNNGLLSFEDWDIIENDLINRQKALLLSEHDRIVAGAAWEQAQGKGVF